MAKRLPNIVPLREQFAAPLSQYPELSRVHDFLRLNAEVTRVRISAYPTCAGSFSRAGSGRARKKAGGAIAGSRGVARRRGGPISAGWNHTAAAIVQHSANAISSPMLDRPGCGDSHRLPKAVAVVSALKNTARVRVDATGSCGRCARP